MNTFLWILIVSVAVNHEQVFAKMNRGPGLHENKCCNAPKSSSHTEFVEKMKGFMQTCRQELGITDAPGEKKPGQFVCVMECVGKKVNAVNADGSLNEDGFRSFVTNDLATEDYKKAIADQTVTKCLEEAKSSPNPAPPKDSKCNGIGMKAGMCVHKEFFKACPTEMQDTSEKCVKFRELVNSGKHGNGPPPTSEETN